jgi:hypothetical protein
MSAGTSTALEVVYLTLARTAKQFPSHKADGSVHPATVTRWIIKGVRNGHGQRVFLQAVRSPAGWLVRPEWIDQFLKACTAGRTDSTPPPRTPTQRQRDAERAEEKLKQMGL